MVHTPTLAPFIKKPVRIVAIFKGKRVQAQVRKDGTIAFRGSTYTSPSEAAARACRRDTCNGWVFWKFKDRKSGKLVFIDELRKKKAA